MASIETKLRPFTVPNFVIPVPAQVKRQDGFQSVPGIPLHELSPETIAEMCDEFRVAVFAKSMKKDPAL